LAAAPSIGRASAVEAPAPARGAELTGALYERYSGQIYGFCLHKLGSREEAEDAVQTTFLNAFRGIARGVEPQAESAWLFKIAENVCLSRHRSAFRRRRVESPSDLEALQDVLPGHEPEKDELHGLERVLERMPETQRRAILLREWQGLSYREIADEMGITQAAVETLIFRARRALAQGLETVEREPLRRRARRSVDGGSLLAALKTFIGSAGALKTAATVVAMTSATVVAATPTPMRHHGSGHHPPTVQAPAKARVSPRASAPASVAPVVAPHPAPVHVVVARHPSHRPAAVRHPVARKPAPAPKNVAPAPAAPAAAPAPAPPAAAPAPAQTSVAVAPAQSSPAAPASSPAGSGEKQHSGSTSDRRSRKDRGRHETPAPQPAGGSADQTPASAPSAPAAKRGGHEKKERRRGAGSQPASGASQSSGKGGREKKDRQRAGAASQAPPVTPPATPADVPPVDPALPTSDAPGTTDPAGSEVTAPAPTGTGDYEMAGSGRTRTVRADAR